MATIVHDIKVECEQQIAAASFAAEELRRAKSATQLAKCCRVTRRLFDAIQRLWLVSGLTAIALTRDAEDAVKSILAVEFEFVAKDPNHRSTPDYLRSIRRRLQLLGALRFGGIESSYRILNHDAVITGSADSNVEELSIESIYGDESHLNQFVSWISSRTLDWVEFELNHEVGPMVEAVEDHLKLIEERVRWGQELCRSYELKHLRSSNAEMLRKGLDKLDRVAVVPLRGFCESKSYRTSGEARSLLERVSKTVQQFLNSFTQLDGPQHYFNSVTLQAFALIASASIQPKPSILKMRGEGFFPSFNLMRSLFQRGETGSREPLHPEFFAWRFDGVLSMLAQQRMDVKITYGNTPSKEVQQFLYAGSNMRRTPTVDAIFCEDLRRHCLISQNAGIERSWGKLFIDGQNDVALRAAVSDDSRSETCVRNPTERASLQVHAI